MLRGSLVLLGNEVIRCEVEKYAHGDQYYAVVETGGLTLQIREDVLESFAGQINTAVAEIKKARLLLEKADEAHPQIEITTNDVGRDTE